jgi:hypothetical protein
MYELAKEAAMEREPEPHPETQTDLNQAPQEEVPLGEPLSPEGSEEAPPTTQPGAARAEDVSAAQVLPHLAPKLPGAPEEKDQEQFLGMLVIRDLRDREGHLLLRAGETVTAPALAEIQAAGCLRELAQVVRPPIPPVAPLGME